MLLFGIVIPFALWIISERAAQAGLMLSALMMLLALVLGSFSFRDILGKITVVCSMVTLLLYGAMISLKVRRPGPIQADGEQVETGNPEPQPMPGYDFTSPRAAMESLIEAAKKGDAEAFKRGVSSDMLEMMAAETMDWSEPMRDISELTFSGVISQDGDTASVRLTGGEAFVVVTFPLVREENEWKITLPAGEP